MYRVSVTVSAETDVSVSANSPEEAEQEAVAAVREELEGLGFENLDFGYITVEEED